MSLSPEQRRIVQASDRQFRPTLRDRITRFGELQSDGPTMLAFIILFVTFLVGVGLALSAIIEYALWLFIVAAAMLIPYAIFWAIRYFIRETNDA